MPNSNENFPDAFDLRISISWPEIYDRERGGYWEKFLETESELRFGLEEFISESSNNRFRLNELFYRRGSIELFIVVGATYAFLKEVKDYKDLRESIDKLCEDVSSLVNRFCQRVMPGALQGANLFYVKTAWNPRLSMQKESSPIFQESTRLPASPYTIYLMATNLILILVLVVLLMTKL